MALKLKEFDFKGFLLEKGERVGLYAAGGVAFLMLVLSLFLPGKGLLSPSPRTKADSISKTASDKKNSVVQARPSEAEADDLRKVPGELQKQAANIAEDPDDFRMVAELFAPREIPSTKRQNPTIFSPTEFTARAFTAQISRYMLINEKDGVRIGIVQGGSKDLKGKNPLNIMETRMGRGGMMGGGGGPMMGGMMGMPGGMPGDMRNRGLGGSGGFGPPGEGPGGGTPFGDDKKNLEIKFVKKEELAGVANPVFARDLMPVPMAEVVGAFPLKQQIDEFKNALRAESAYSVVFQETVTDKDKPRQAFDFLGFRVKRRAYGPDGQVVLPPDGKDKDGWQDLDLESPNSAYVITVGQVLKDFAPEDPKIAPLLVHGLYLPRPVQVTVKEGQDAAPKAYPEIEKDLPKIEKTLEKMKEKDAGPALPPTKLDEGTFNPFGDSEAEKGTAAAGGNALPTASEWSPPEYCVLRFLDLTIQPGLTYEYQVQVRMRNPNYNKPESEVANKQLTRNPELESEWYPVKGPNGQMVRVSVEPDLHFYAVDEQALQNGEEGGKKKYKGMNANVTYDTAHYVPVQIHKWVGTYEVSGKDRESKFYPVGDWVVGERVLAVRGELVGTRPVSAHVPVWAPEKSQFMLAGRPPSRAGRGGDTRPTSPITFIEARRAPLLVDFEAGTLTYRHAAPPPPKNEDGTPVDGYRPPQTTEVKSASGEEVLFLTPDGKLVGRVSASDDLDPKRKEREEEYMKRVADAEKEPNNAAPGKPGDPFGGRGGGAP
jgi:hypothetical protein